jgi:hypothetical protein
MAAADHDYIVLFSVYSSCSRHILT